MACGRRCPVTGNVSALFKPCLPAVEALLAHSSWAPSNRCFLSLLDICCNAPASMSDDGAMVALQAWFCSSLCGLPSPMSQAMYEYEGGHCQKHERGLVSINAQVRCLLPAELGSAGFCRSPLAFEVQATMSGNLPRGLHLMACCRRRPANDSF